MAKLKTSYCCNACGAVAPKWSGQCGDCGAWNSLVESVEAKPSGGQRFSGYSGDATSNHVRALDQVDLKPESRIQTGMQELDRVLGGGLTSGSVVLIGGDPGIGKSTLLTQTMAALSTQQTILYVSGEESLHVQLHYQR